MKTNIKKQWMFKDYNIAITSYGISKDLLEQMKIKYDFFNYFELSFVKLISVDSNGVYRTTDECYITLNCYEEYMDLFGAVLDYMENVHGKKNYSN